MLLLLVLSRNTTAGTWLQQQRELKPYSSVVPVAVW
jgi:hypothetical protein